MTTLEHSGAATVRPRPSRAHAPAPPDHRLGIWFTSVDHNKKIGILCGGTPLAFLVIGGVEALLIRLQLTGRNGSVLPAAQCKTMFTKHGPPRSS